MPFSAPSSPPETSVRNRLRPKYCNPAQLRGSAVKLFEAGFGYVRAARMLNIPANTVKDWSNAWKKGTFKTEISPSLFRYNRYIKEKAVRLRLTGHTLKEVSEMTGASQTSVKRWVEAYVAKKGLQGSVFSSRVQEDGGIKLRAKRAIARTKRFAVGRKAVRMPALLSARTASSKAH